MFKTSKTQFTSLALTATCILGQATLALADGPAVPAGSAPAAGGAQQPSPIMSLVPFVAMFAVVYFLMIRPQQKRMKEQQNMLAKLATGDEVVTTGGLLGRITEVGEPYLTLEIAAGVRVHVLKSQVSQVVPKGTLKAA